MVEQYPIMVPVLQCQYLWVLFTTAATMRENRFSGDLKIWHNTTSNKKTGMVNNSAPTESLPLSAGICDAQSLIFLLSFDYFSFVSAHGHTLWLLLSSKQLNLRNLQGLTRECMCTCVL